MKLNKKTTTTNYSNIFISSVAVTSEWTDERKSMIIAVCFMFLNDEETKNRETKTAHTKMDAIFILYIKTNDNISIVMGTSNKLLIWFHHKILNISHTCGYFVWNKSHRMWYKVAIWEKAFHIQIHCLMTDIVIHKWISSNVFDFIS